MLLAAIQYVLFTRVLPMAVLREMLADIATLNVLPPTIIAAIQNMHGVSIALFITGLLTLPISIALLKRRNWARIVFAWLMIVTAIAHFAGAIVPFILLQGAAPALDAIPQELRGAVVMVKTMLMLASVVMGIVFGAGFAWVAKRLFDADVRQEFAATR
jgi:hypothetical protein